MKGGFYVDKLSLMQVFEYPAETLFKCSMGVKVKTVGKFDKILYYQSPWSEKEWTACPNDIKYATATYKLINN